MGDNEESSENEWSGDFENKSDPGGDIPNLNDFFDTPPTTRDQLIASADQALTEPSNVRERFRALLPFAVDIYEDLLTLPSTDDKTRKSAADKVLSINGIGEPSSQAPPLGGTVAICSKDGVQALVATFGAVGSAAVVQIKDMKNDQNEQRNVTPEGNRN